MKKNKTTKKHFEIFKAECEKWIEFFGLKGWRVEYWHEYCKGARASCSYSFEDRTADIYLSTEWNSPINISEIKRTAFHEACEVLFIRIRVIAEYRYIDKSEVDEEVHALVRTLENTVFNKQY